MISIGYRWSPKAQYIGRGSPLGNPFPISPKLSRDEACDVYHHWFHTQIQNKNPVVLQELRRLFRLAKQEDVTLGCFCAPKRCHGETIKAFLDSHM